MKPPTPAKLLADFLLELDHWLHDEHKLHLSWRKIDDDGFNHPEVDVEIETVQEDKGPLARTYYIGDFPDSVLNIRWLGKIGGWPVVLLNGGVLMSALPRHVAGWIAGYK